MNSSNSSQYLSIAMQCRQSDCAMTWLKIGMNDIRKATLARLSYGFVMALMIMVVAMMAWNFGSAWLMLSLLCSFVFAAPLACIGTYAVSAQNRA